MNRVFVFDLDGVIRHWNPDIVSNAERTNGLPDDALLGTAFEPELLLGAVTGVVTDEAWREEVVRRLLELYPTANAAGAVTAWSEPAGEILDGSLDVLARARKIGTVCLLSNATSRLESDLAALGIDGAFDHIFNSSRIGFAKPDAQVFAHVERNLGTEPDQIVYLDDGAVNVQTALDRGWNGLLVEPEANLKQLMDPWLNQSHSEST